MKSKMKSWLHIKSWRYAVPPDFNVHIIISEHPMRNSKGRVLYSRFYVSAESWHITSGRWHYVANSTKGGNKTFNEAFDKALLMWEGVSKVKKPGNLNPLISVPD